MVSVEGVLCCSEMCYRVVSVEGVLCSSEMCYRVVSVDGLGPGLVFF